MLNDTCTLSFFTDICTCCHTQESVVAPEPCPSRVLPALTAASHLHNNGCFDEALQVFHRRGYWGITGGGYWRLLGFPGRDWHYRTYWA